MDNGAVNVRSSLELRRNAEVWHAVAACNNSATIGTGTLSSRYLLSLWREEKSPCDR